MENSDDCFFALFQQVDDFIRKFDPTKYSPPFISQHFAQIRIQTFCEFEVMITNGKISNKNEKLAYFISKFEVEYIETLKTKIRGQYVSFILQNGYEIPEDLNVEKLKSLGGMSEFIQVVVAVTERLLEIEAMAYTIKGLEMYGFLASKGPLLKDYFNSLKDQYKQPTKGHPYAEYVVDVVSKFSLDKLGAMLAAKGISNVSINQKKIMEMVLLYARTGHIPWKLMMEYTNLPWLVAGFTAPYLLDVCSSYIARKNILYSAYHIQSALEENKLFFMNKRKDILDLVLESLNKKEITDTSQELDTLSKLVESVLSPSQKKQENEQSDRDEFKRNYNIKESEDCVVVEEKEIKEHVDETGVVVID